MEEIYKMLDDNGIMGEVWETKDEFFGTPMVHIEITWGDWKHDHARCDYLMDQLGYGFISAVETEEDGSDCYSAIHNYVKRDCARC